MARGKHSTASATRRAAEHAEQNERLSKALRKESAALVAAEAKLKRLPVLEERLRQLETDLTLATSPEVELLTKERDDAYARLAEIDEMREAFRGVIVRMLRRQTSADLLLNIREYAALAEMSATSMAQLLNRVMNGRPGRQKKGFARRRDFLSDAAARREHAADGYLFASTEAALMALLESKPDVWRTDPALLDEWEGQWESMRIEMAEVDETPDAD